jgi:hypothetical protein
LEITVLSNFQAVLHRFATQGATTYTVENLLKKNKTYYWRVRPFNRWHTCKSYSPVFSFQTGDVETVNTTTTVQHLPQLNILRNPIPHGSPEALFTVSAPLPNPLSVALVAPTGGILRKQSLPAVPADGIVRLAVDNLPPGLYFILVETAAQVLSGKLMIR